MALMTKAPRGTADMLPYESEKIHFLEQVFKDVAEVYGYREIRTPVFEHTELFNRSVGETTDVVQKEMYTFNDNGGRSITLRPEGTAGAARALLEHGLYSEPMPQKLYYNVSCYRYEKPQAGRLREFHQFGVECFGSAEPIADAEVIALAKSVFDQIGIKKLSLEINSIGCPECRAKYHAALKAFFDAHKDALCETCLGRLDKNPMRILDCKSPVCKEIAADAPVILDYLCEECDEHFKGVQENLNALGISYRINPRIVRGLDYYTRTVFEFVSNSIGAQGTVCGGGRYDGLIEELGGNTLPALGFGMGVERLKLVAEAEDAVFPEEAKCNLFVICADREAEPYVTAIVAKLRAMQIHVERDICNRSVKAQMKYANKIGAEFSVVIGKNEIDKGVVSLKSMEDGTSDEFPLDSFVEDFLHLYTEAFMSELLECTDDGEDDEMSDFDPEAFLQLLEGGKGKNE